MSLTELTGDPQYDQLLMPIAERGYMNIDESTNLLDISAQMIRRDIRRLSEQGLITRHYGGVGRAFGVADTAFEQREALQTKKREAVAEMATDYIPDGSTILIITSATVEHVARALLNHNHLWITTNNLRVAHIPYHNPRFEAMMSGGTLRSYDSGIIDPSAVSSMADFCADYLVTSIGAIESNDTLMEFDVSEAGVVETMMAHARNILLVADHTRYHASTMVEIGNMAQATALSTDGLPPVALKLRLQDSQIEIIFPQEDA